ncbi:putative sulfate transporter YbaR [Nymphon striatum]|nr:putative sulfate transporter YbaR [Nymphon striatum]
MLRASTRKLFLFKRPESFKNDLLSGLTVALALVPEAVAFAILAHLHPLTGLYAAFTIGLIASIVGGRPGMISGATGAIAVVVGTLVLQHGEEYLFAAVIMMGLIQITFGVLKMGKFIRLVPHPVFLGFVNGLALVILIAQFEHFKVPGPNDTHEWISGSALYIMIALIALTMVIIQVLPKYTKAIPSTLAAIIVGTLLVIGLNLDTRTVADMASIKGVFPPFHLPEIDLSWEAFKIVFPYAVIMALVGLIESLLTLNLVDELTETTGHPNRECIGQGVANTVTGMFSGYGWLCHEVIPIAVLVGVMFMVVIGTFEWGSLRLLGKIPITDWLIIVAVTVITVISDNLALAVIVGVILSALVFAWEHAKHIEAEIRVDRMGNKVYEITGPLFFASISNFQEIFTPKEDTDDVVVDFKNSRIADHSAIEAIDKLADRYDRAGKRLHIKHLSKECRVLLKKAGPLVEVNVVEDPEYHVAADNVADKLKTK